MPVERNNFDDFTDVGAANRAALTAMGLACLQVAQPLCPVQTGNLRRSHGYSVATDHVDIGASADYAAYVHNGTSTRRGNPWLRNAVNRNQRSIAEAGINAWKGAIE